jgi:hypothetical protein
MAEGFVSKFYLARCTWRDVWDVAESYFNELINRSMIQPIYDKYIYEVRSCKVYDMLLDLIVRRCKENNFLHLVNDPKAVAEVQDEVIRRLTVVGLRDAEDDIEVPITIGQKLSQIRSLNILGKFNWAPLLLEFKFLRVLLLQNYYGGIKIDMTWLNQLSQLSYLNVRVNVLLSCQIRGLRHLETLDLFSSKEISNIALEIEIADVPCLCHLVVPWCTRLPDGIGKLKSLRTLHNFILPINSLESIIGLGQLTALSDLGYIFPKECAP